MGPTRWQSDLGENSTYTVYKGINRQWPKISTYAGHNLFGSYVRVISLLWKFEKTNLCSKFILHRQLIQGSRCLISVPFSVASILQLCMKNGSKIPVILIVWMNYSKDSFMSFRGNTLNGFSNYKEMGQRLTVGIMRLR